MAVVKHNETQTWSRTQNTKHLPVLTNVSDGCSFTSDSSGLTPSCPLYRTDLGPLVPELSLLPDSTHSRANSQILQLSRESPSQSPDPVLASFQHQDATRFPVVCVPVAVSNQPTRLRYQRVLGGLWGTLTAPQHPLFIYFTPKPAPREHRGQQHTLWPWTELGCTPA